MYHDVSSIYSNVGGGFQKQQCNISPTVEKKEREKRKKERKKPREKEKDPLLFMKCS